MTKDASAADHINETLSQLLPEKWSTEQIASTFGPAGYQRDEDLFNTQFANIANEFIAQGGKRLRPQFFFAFLGAFGIHEHDAYAKLAAVIEIIHNATLVIDDVEDNSELRRGKPTMHKTLGIDVAINNGVMLHLLPIVILKESGLEPTLRMKITDIFMQELLATYYGQTLDIGWHRDPQKIVAEEEYMEMCRLKTGSLMRMSAHFAGVIAEKDDNIIAATKKFAESAGIAFQIRDDVLDLTGTPEEFGKSYGNDITEGKKSLPVILALQQLAPAEADVLREILSEHTRDEQRINQAQELIASTTALGDASEKAESLFEAGWEQVADLFTDEEGARHLRQLSEQFINRQK